MSAAKETKLISTIEPDKLTPKQIEIVLGIHWEEDEEATADCVFVFCNDLQEFLQERVDKAIHLYKAGKAPYILFSGGNAWGKRDFIEAVRAKERAMELGVPESAILIETESYHTKENVIASLFVLERKLGLHKLKRILVVSHEGHLRRCLLTLRTYMPNWIEYAISPVKLKMIDRDHWWDNTEVKELAIKQVKDLVTYIRQGQLVDEQIEI